MRSWFPWNGSKRWLAPRLADVFGQWSGDGAFVDPFCGGGSPARVMREVHPQVPLRLSDANPWLIGVYRAHLAGEWGLPTNFDVGYQRGLVDTDLDGLAEADRANRFGVCLYSAWGNRWETQPSGAFRSTVRKDWTTDDHLRRKLGAMREGAAWLDTRDTASVRDVFAALDDVRAGDLLYLDPPYPDTLGYGNQFWSFGDHLRLLCCGAALARQGVAVVVGNPGSLLWLFEGWGFDVALVAPPRRGKTSKDRREVLAWCMGSPKAARVHSRANSQGLVLPVLPDEVRLEQDLGILDLVTR